MSEEWDDKEGYLAGSWILRHNDDYLEFLVRNVWAITAPCRVVEFGCGYGRFGLALMPLLPRGSTYRGFDETCELIRRAPALWADTPYQAEFALANACDAPYADDSFDVAVSHLVLMHLPNPQKALDEMIRVTRGGGLVISCDANRNAHSAIFHIAESEEQEQVPLAMFQSTNREIRRTTGVDYNIGVKTPVLMHKAGLENVGARVSDCVRMLFPPIDSDEKRALFSAIAGEGYATPARTDENLADWKAHFMRYGISEADVLQEYRRQLDRDFSGNAARYHTVSADLLSFSFGTVAT